MKHIFKYIYIFFFFFFENYVLNYKSNNNNICWNIDELNVNAVKGTAHYCMNVFIAGDFDAGPKSGAQSTRMQEGKPSRKLSRLWKYLS